MKNIKSWEEYNISEGKKHHDPNAEVRNRGDVVFDANDKKVNDDKDHFPINSISQARNAIARVNQYDTVPKWYEGTLKELINKVYREVSKKYPSIEIDEDKKG